MKCAELAATLESQLLRECDLCWLLEARRHAEPCPSCSRLLEVHRIEEQLTHSSEVEPSGAFLENVMSRVTLQKQHRALSVRRFSPDALQKPMIFVGALILAVAYLVPSAGEPWLAALWPSVGLFRTPFMFAYLAVHPPWAIILAGVAALCVVSGLALPESRGAINVARNTIVQ